MNLPEVLRRLLAVLLCAAAVFAMYFAVERPRMLRWGATDAEWRAHVPGEEHMAPAAFRSTRAIAIDAPPERVWPWLAQLGQDRGGFYSYDVLENAVGCTMPRASAVQPDLQQWHPGDRLWMYPRDQLNGAGSAALVGYQPGRELVFATRQIGTPLGDPENGLWSFQLEASGPRASRLIVHSTSAGRMSAAMTLVQLGLFEPTHFAMERRMLLNLKSLAEGHPTSRLAEQLQVATWTLTVCLLILGLIEVGRRRRWLRPLFVAVAAALVFQTLTLLQPAWPVGALLVGALAVSLGRPRARTHV